MSVIKTAFSFFSNLHNYFNIQVCLSLQRWRCPVPSRHTFKFHHSQRFRGQVRLLPRKVQPSHKYLILKPHGQSSRSPVRQLLSEAKPSCVYSIFKPHSQSFRSPDRLLLSKAKPSYVYSILKPHGQSSRSQSDCC